MPKPKVVFVSFSGGKNPVHRANQELQRKPNQAHIPGLINCRYMTAAKLNRSFFRDLPPKLRAANLRGFHFWVWKPYVILETMKKSPEDCVVVYLDAGAYAIASFAKIIQLAHQHGRVFIENFHTNQAYCKCEPVQAYLSANPKLQQAFWEKMQLDAALMLFKNTAQQREFVSKWLQMCLQEDHVMDGTSTHCTNPREFRDHRHDQALLSLAQTLHPANSLCLPHAWKQKLILHHRRRKLEPKKN